MATKATLDLLLSHTQFAKLNATEQYNRLIAYYSRWFEPNFDIHAIDNIRASQRLTTYSRLMNTPVGVALLTLLTDACSIGTSTEASAGRADTGRDAAAGSEDRGTNSTLVGEPEAEPEEVPMDCLEPPARESEDCHRESLESVAGIPTPEPEQPAPKPQARSRGSKAKAR